MNLERYTPQLDKFDEEWASLLESLTPEQVKQYGFDRIPIFEAARNIVKNRREARKDDE